MASYVKGRRFEYRVRDLFREHGFVVIRSAKSKSIDLICLKNGTSILVECKVKKSSLSKDGRADLIGLADVSRAIPILAYKEKRKVKMLNLQTGEPFRIPEK